MKENGKNNDRIVFYRYELTSVEVSRRFRNIPDILEKQVWKIETLYR
jgi:hypothetical protein